MPVPMIVVTDDDPQILSLVGRLLHSYDVKMFLSPLEAQQHLESLDDAPLLLITDLILPDMIGTDLARDYRTRFPNLPILLISGYTEDPVVIEPPCEFLAKPFTPEQLKEAVAGLLARSE